MDYTRNDVAIDLGVLIQEPQSTFGIVTIRGAASLFVDTAVTITNAASAKSA